MAYKARMFDYLQDQVELVLDEYVHLPLVGEFVNFEINLTGFGSKNLHINMCILCFETFDHLYDELILILDEYVHLPHVDDLLEFEIIFIGFGSEN